MGMRAGRDTSYQGSPHIKTPHLDALVANGVRLDYFYAARQMCSPGRFGILTGRAPLPLLDGKLKEREKPIGFMLWHQEQAPVKTPLGAVDFVKGTQGVSLDGSLQLVVAQAGQDGGTGRRNRPGLYDIHADPRDSKGLSAAMPDRAAAVRAALNRWRQSVRDSFDGKD